MMIEPPPDHTFFLDSVKKYGNQPALIGEGATYTYRDYADIIRGTSKKIEECGFRKRELVAISALNSMEYVNLLFSLWKSGIVAVPVNTRWPVQRVEEQLLILGCNKLFVDRISGDLPKEKLINLYHLESFIDWSLNPIRKLETTDLIFHLNWDATVIFTSGSSGEPKAAMHTLGNHYYNALGSNRNIPFGPGDRWLLSLPLYHVGGLAILFRAILGGGAVVIPDKTSSLEKSIKKYEPSHISLVPTQLYRLLQTKEVIEELRKMKAVLLGGAPIPNFLIRQSVENKLPIHTSYGSTEMASQITTTRVGDSPEKLRTSGKLLPHRDLQISSDGEILVKGRTLFQGYLEGNQITQVTDSKGWFHSGDLGFLDDDGYLIVTGRRDNLFISGGENIQPEEIEKAILQITGVMNVVVVPVRDKEFGERPAAFIRMEQGSTPDFFRIKKQLEEELPRFKVPDYFFPWPEEDGPGIKINRVFLKNIADQKINQDSE